MSDNITVVEPVEVAEPAEVKISDNIQNLLLHKLMGWQTTIIGLYLTGPDETYHEPHITFNPCMNGFIESKDEKLAKLKRVKIRVTLDMINPKNGQTFKRIGPIGNMTIDDIVSGFSSGSIERIVGAFFPESSFDPSFNEQVNKSLKRE